MNGYNRCGVCGAPMMYNVPVQQVPVKQDTKATQESCDKQAQAPVQMATPMYCGAAPMCGPMVAPMMPVQQDAKLADTCNMQVPVQQMAPLCGPMQFETTCQVVEPTVCCTPEVHHHHRVEHIVPVVVQNVHHHHNHHDYVICKQEGYETHQYDHGLRNEDWCALAMQQDPCNPYRRM